MPHDPNRYLVLARELDVTLEGVQTIAQLRERIWKKVTPGRLPTDVARPAAEFVCEELAWAALRHNDELDARAYKQLVAIGERWYPSNALLPAETVARHGELVTARFIRALTDETRDPWRREWHLRAAFRLLDHAARPLAVALLGAPRRRFTTPYQRLLRVTLEELIQRRLRVEPAGLERLASAPSPIPGFVELYRATIDDPRELIERALSGAHQGHAQLAAWRVARELTRDGLCPPECAPCHRQSQVYGAILAADQPVGWELPRALPQLTGKHGRTLAGRLRLLHLLYHRRLLVTILQRRPGRARRQSRQHSG